MGTKSVIYLDGEFLCHCGYDGQPYSLGEYVEGVSEEFEKKEIKEYYPQGLSEKLLKSCREGYADGIEHILFEPPNELYKAPSDYDCIYIIIFTVFRYDVFKS